MGAAGLSCDTGLMSHFYLVADWPVVFLLNCLDSVPLALPVTFSQLIHSQSPFGRRTVFKPRTSLRVPLACTIVRRLPRGPDAYLNEPSI